MELRSYGDLTEWVRELRRSLVSIEEQAQDPAVRDIARSQREGLRQVSDVIDFYFVQEGVNKNLSSSPDAEIKRQPSSVDAFSCTPTFIIGTRRSGTTLLCYLLNSSSTIAPLPENFFAGRVADDQQLLSAGRALCQALSEPVPRFGRRLGQFIDEFYRDYAARLGKSRWVSKELFIPTRLDNLDAMFDYRSRFVYAVRHGFSVAWSCASKFMVRDGASFGRESSLNLENYLREWIDGNEAMMDFYERNRDRCLMVRYEDFVRRPSEIGRLMFEFLDEPWTDDLLDKMQGQSLHGMGDNKILKTRGRIVAEEKQEWKHWPSGLVTTLARKANPTLERLGYDTIPTTSACREVAAAV